MPVKLSIDLKFQGVNTSADYLSFQTLIDDLVFKNLPEVLRLAKELDEAIARCNGIAAQSYTKPDKK